MNALRFGARRQVRTLMRPAVRSCTTLFTTSPSMQLRTVNVAAKKDKLKAKKKALLSKMATAKQEQITLVARAQRAAKVAKMARIAKENASLKVKVAVNAERVAKKNAALKARAAAIRTKMAAKRKKKLAEEEAKAAIREAALEKKRAVKDAIYASGSVRPFTLFVQKTTFGTSYTPLKTVAAQWKALSEDQKQQYRVQAKKNLETRNTTRQSLKTTPSNYALFTKEHFSAAYEAAKKTAGNSKEAFRIASAAVAKKYRGQRAS